MSQADIGDVVNVAFDFKDDDGAFVDPAAIRARVLAPDGTTTTYVYGTDVELTQLAVGRYNVAVPATLAGVWWVMGQGTGTNIAAEPVRFIVNDNPLDNTATFIDVAAVERYTPGRAPFDGRTKPTRDEVQGILEDASAEIDSVLIQAGYALPIPTSATAAYRLVQAACAKCAAAAVEDVAPTKDEENRRATRRMCEAAKRMIESGELPGIDRDATTSSPRGGFPATSYFSRDMEL